jgi:hypothetical protein
MSKDNRLLVCLALKVAQAGLAEGLNHLMVATAVHAGNGGPMGEGESSFVTAGGGTLGVGGAFCSQLNQFLRGGLGGRGEDTLGMGNVFNTVGSGGCTILASESSVGGAFILPILQGYESRIITPPSLNMGG